MMQKVQFDNVKKNQIVVLKEDLPTDRLFGNQRPIKKHTRGYVSSDGFVSGVLKVTFDSHFYGKQIVQFSEFSAKNYLETDIY